MNYWEILKNRFRAQKQQLHTLHNLRAANYKATTSMHTKQIQEKHIPQEE